LLVGPIGTIVGLTGHGDIKELSIYKKEPCNSKCDSKVEDHDKVSVWYSKDNMLKDEDLQIETSYRRKKKT
jgi:hypothetical protein